MIHPRTTKGRGYHAALDAMTPREPAVSKPSHGQLERLTA
ncbi:hypothetical protein FAGKG844_380025 [Frankia sp. AgKG'84/4]